jgi:hypothetical protein
MTQMRFIAQGVNDPPPLALDPRTTLAPDPNTPWTVVVVERGMASGQPAVAVVVEFDNGGVIVQTSLDKFLAAASSMATLAETRFGWTRPEGHATLMPPDRATRKRLLEAMRAELEAWDETETP